MTPDETAPRSWGDARGSLDFAGCNSGGWWQVSPEAGEQAGPMADARWWCPRGSTGTCATLGKDQEDQQDLHRPQEEGAFEGPSKGERGWLDGEEVQAVGTVCAKAKRNLRLDWLPDHVVASRVGRGVNAKPWAWEGRWDQTLQAAHLGKRF